MITYKILASSQLSSGVCKSVTKCDFQSHLVTVTHSMGFLSKQFHIPRA